MNCRTSPAFDELGNDADGISVDRSALSLERLGDNSEESGREGGEMAGGVGG